MSNITIQKSIVINGEYGKSKYHSIKGATRNIAGHMVRRVMANKSYGPGRRFLGKGFNYDAEMKERARVYNKLVKKAKRRIQPIVERLLS